MSKKYLIVVVDHQTNKVLDRHFFTTDSKVELDKVVDEIVIECKINHFGRITEVITCEVISEEIF